MEKVLKDKWVKALRSGDYEQCRNSLHDEQGHCCLGVLAIVSGIDVKAIDETIAGYAPIYELIGNDSKARELSMRNDGWGYDAHSFTEIAEYIEANL
jgi:hypothetical protein